MDFLKSLVVWLCALCFMGILFPVTFIIWLIVLPLDSQRIVTHWMLVYQAVIIAAIIPVWKIRIEGREKASSDATYVIISNHQSILDILLINCLRYKFKWISKIENMKVPVLGWYLRMAGYLTVNRGNEESKAEMLEKAMVCLKNGNSIMIFPEGTRSLNGETGFFKRGAFVLAIQAGVPILPVLIDGTSEILPKHGLKFLSGYNVRIRVLDPVLPAEFDTDNPDLLAAKLSNLMKSELSNLRAGLK
jgi:1-acyl-sn-glycerol-3-phosphate acyltransferase